ncbi:MAG: S-layer homology domain-containing protein, partial [Oscillospiraceae bacterium]|nr:S-layer homology domain-containing protein [Oscillospiraceae bacterium]
GTVTGGGDYVVGTPVTVTATPNSGYAFDGWYDVTDPAAPQRVSNSAAYTFTAADARALSASFQRETSGPSTPTTPVVPPTNPPLAVPSEPYYDDVPEGHFFYDAIQALTDLGLMVGTGDRTFSPNGQLTRGMMATILYRLEGKPAVTGEAPFSDVVAGEWYADGVLWAAQSELLLGYTDGRSGWNDPITREDLVTILYRYAKSKGEDVSAAVDLSAYTDAAQVSDWALPATKWAVSIGLLQGRTGTTLVPKGTATRAEVALFYQRYIEKFPA